MAKPKASAKAVTRAPKGKPARTSSTNKTRAKPAPKAARGKPAKPAAAAGAAVPSPTLAPVPLPPPRRPSSPAGGYEAHRDAMATASRARSAKGREIGGIPDVADPDRRERCRSSLKLFCETYNPLAFSLGWSDDHLRAIARIEEAVTQGALFALAMARGSGKTTLCRHAALWAASYATCRYPFVIGATDEKARETLDTLRTLVRFLDDYADDFPEISWPAKCLAGIANRATGQTCGDESTLIEWSTDRIVLPTVPPPSNWPKHWPLRTDGQVPTSGVLISASGLTGEGIRGSLKTLTTGEMVRPDLVLLDDPQTPESARSRTQNETRLRLVAADVLGMAGPDKTIAAVMPCTVIERGDMVDQVLDRDKHPLWRGERSGILESLPSDMAAWDAYFEVYARCAQTEPPDFAEANAHYLARRAELDAGAKATWEDRKKPGEVSAIQSAMHLYFRDRRAFMAEYQNQPEPVGLAGQLPDLDADEIAAKVNEVPRGVAPPHCTRLTAGVDVGGEIIWWVVCGWGENFSGAVVDYGTFPRQTRAYFAAADARPAMSDQWPNHNEHARVYAGVKETVRAVLARRHPAAGGGELMVEKCLVDSGKWSKEVAEACRQQPESYARCVVPSKGWGGLRAPMNSWKRDDGERWPPGDNWRDRRNKDGAGRRIDVEVNHWKSFAARSLLTPEMGPGCLQLFGSDPSEHRLFADHLTAEVRTVPFRRTGGDQREVEVWQPRPGRPDNHWWDALVLATAAASVAGLKWDAPAAAGESPRARVARPHVKLSEKQKQKQTQRAGG